MTTNATGRSAVRPTTVVLAGDSITEWGRHDDPDGLGNGYVRLLADGPLRGARVWNAGVGGDRIRDLATRWERDVLLRAPDVVSVYVGVNDTWRRFDQGDETTPAEFEAVYRGLIGPLSAKGTLLVLVEPFVVPVTPDQGRWSDDLAAKQDVVRRLAAATGAVHVATAAPLAELANRVGPEAVAADGVHPTALGHAELARLWWEAAGDRLTPGVGGFSHIVSTKGL
jgi:lysophospholipase L1-like esterase